MNGPSLGIVEKFCDFRDIIGARGGANDSVITQMRREWSSEI